MTPQEYQQQQKAKLVACYNIEKSTEVKKDIQVADVELITDQERLSDIKKESFENDVVKSLDNENSFLSKAFDIINKSLDVFEKGGEGSRGGKIIGHTKSGKPIYKNANHIEHKNFNKEDHADAENLHKELSKEHLNKWEKSKQEKRDESSLEEHGHHVDQANEHQARKNK